MRMSRSLEYLLVLRFFKLSNRIEGAGESQGGIFIEVSQFSLQVFNNTVRYGMTKIKVDMDYQVWLQLLNF